jgi:LDH2 family malate/lactate/ureidoglycolate dehydrogenase
MNAAARRLGPRAVEGALALHEVVAQAAGLGEEQRLALVNQFYNRRVLFRDDLEVWGQVDYWASPLETLNKGEGDCEDYAIAKYFTLLAAGVPGSRLRMVYVRAQMAGPGGPTQAHMVLAWTPPAGGEPLILDFATSRIALGKVRVALNKGEQVGPDTLLDRDGHPTTEPGVMFDKPIGALLTFGEHKGSGLSIMAEILSALLGRGTSVDEARHADVVITNLFGIIIDPARLGADAATREERLGAFVDYLKSSTPRDPAKPVMMPGDPERAARAKRSAEGIPVDAETWHQIVEAARYVGVDADAVL